MEIKRFEIGNEKSISEVESKLDISLPNDYKEFLHQNNGAKVDDGYFFVKDLNEYIMMDTFFGISISKKALDIIEVNNEFDGEIPSKSILIGDEPGGGLILLVNDGEDNGIYYYDHSYSFEQSSDEKNSYIIANTFQDFVDMLSTSPPNK